MYILELINSCIGTVLSFLVVLKFKNKRKNIGYFFVSKISNKNFIDRRSYTYLNEKKIKKGISIVRSQNFINSIKIFLVYKNIILMNYIVNFIEALYLTKKSKKKKNFCFTELYF